MAMDHENDVMKDDRFFKNNFNFFYIYFLKRYFVMQVNSSIIVHLHFSIFWVLWWILAFGFFCLFLLVALALFLKKTSGNPAIWHYQFTSRHNKGGTWVSAALAAAVTRTFKGLTDKKFKLLYGNVNYKNMIYYLLFVFILLTYSIENFSSQLKL